MPELIPGLAERMAADEATPYVERDPDFGEYPPGIDRAFFGREDDAR